MNMHYCAMAEVNKEYICSYQGRSTPVSWYGVLLSLPLCPWGASLLLVIPQYPCVFVVQVAQQVVSTQFSSYILRD